jgi:hypothetical protein
VVGVSGSELGDAPAVFGNNNILHTDLSNFSGVSNAVLEEATRLPVGVEGVSWSGLGVYGISLNLNPDKTGDLPQQGAGIGETASGVIPDAVDPDPRNETAPAGVLGLSVRGADVRGASRFDRGGIFQSATARDEQPPAFFGLEDPRTPAVAQIRLVPHRLNDANPDKPGFNPRLPEDGQTRDLLAMVSPDPNFRFQSSTLWFCERGRTTTGPAVWRRVALAETVIGT